MGKSITVTPEDLQKASQTLESQAEIYTQIYTKLLQDASTMGSAWQGDDNLAFVTQINGFCEDLKAMADKLTLASQALDSQASNYLKRQEANITGVKKLAN